VVSAVKDVIDIQKLTHFCPCDLKSYEAVFTTTRVNYLYQQMILWLWIRQPIWQWNATRLLDLVGA